MYLAEMKEENRILEKRIAERDNTNIPQNVTVSPVKKDVEQKAAPLPDYLSQTNGVVYNIGTSFQARILQWHHQGLTIDEIARKLGSGKTEAELIIKLHAN